MERPVLDELATKYVGAGSSLPALYFASSQLGRVEAVFLDRGLACDFGRKHDLYVEGPNGAEQESSWSAETLEDLTMSGYTHCACRDCLDIAIGTNPVLCLLCEEAGCSEDGDSECGCEDEEET